MATIFLHDLLIRFSEFDKKFTSGFRDDISEVLGLYIWKIHKECEKYFKMKQRKELCKVETADIISKIDDRLKVLVDKKMEVEKLKHIIDTKYDEPSEKVIEDIDEFLNQFLTAKPVKNT